MPADGEITTCHPPGRILYYLCTRKHAYTMGILLACYPTSLAACVRLLPYEDLGALRSLARGSFIFTDFDRLSPTLLDRAARFHRYLQHEAGVATPCLNHPRESAMRFTLLRRLWDAGINDFNVYRLNEVERVERFPVFLRHERGHRSPVSPLLASRDELNRGVARAIATGGDSDDIMIVEFWNKPDAQGQFRKFGAYRVGDTIYSQHCFTREHWYVKGPRYGVAADRAAHEWYVQANPHREQLRRIFDLAGIDYGRIDYAVVDDRIQVYEINTNPTVLDDAPRREGDFDNAPFASMHEAAMLAIAAPPLGPPIVLPPQLRDPKRATIDVADNHSAVMKEVVRGLRWRRARVNVGRLAKRALSWALPSR